MPLPSNGGIGMRLNMNRIKLSENKMLTMEASEVPIPSSYASTIEDIVIESG